MTSAGGTNAIVSCIEDLRVKLEKYRTHDLKEFPTRVIFIDPLLKALGWDVRDSDEAELEYPTIDGKSVDYALKINRKPVLFVEAKPLQDTLTDVKAIGQVVSYAATAGIEWCILTNGITYKIYSSTKKVEAPQKLLFEVSIDPKETEGLAIQQVAERFTRFSRDAMAEGLLDEIGERIFTTGKVRKVLNKLFIEPPDTLIRLIRSRLGDDSIKPSQVKDALKRLWSQTSEVMILPTYQPVKKSIATEPKEARSREYTERHHVQGKPQEVIELFRAIDKFCMDRETSAVQKQYLKHYVKYTYGKRIFCCVHLQKSGLRVWLKLRYSDLESPPDFVRDVSNIGHWGVGDVELAIDTLERFDAAKVLIQQSFEENKPS